MEDLMKRYALYSALFMLVAMIHGIGNISATGLCTGYLIGFAITTIISLTTKE